MTTYGIKVTVPTIQNPRILTATGEVMASIFVGGGGLLPMEWKTRAGAQRRCEKMREVRSELRPRVSVEVFEITDNQMNY